MQKSETARSYIVMWVWTLFVLVMDKCFIKIQNKSVLFLFIRLHWWQVRYCNKFSKFIELCFKLILTAAILVTVSQFTFFLSLIIFLTNYFLFFIIVSHCRQINGSIHSCFIYFICIKFLSFWFCFLFLIIFTHSNWWANNL